MSKITVDECNFKPFKCTIVERNFGPSKVTVVDRNYEPFEIKVGDHHFGPSKITVGDCNLDRFFSPSSFLFLALSLDQCPFRQSITTFAKSMVMELNL